MKPVFVTFSRIAFSVCLAGVCLVACNKQSEVTPQQTAQATEAAIDNSQIVALTKEVLDLTQEGLASEGLIEESPIIANQSARRNQGCRPVISGTYTLITRTTDTLAYSGTITIDYGDGSACSDSVRVRKGKITDVFTVTIIGNKQSGMKPAVSHQETITFENFQKDSAIVNGTFIKQATSGITTITAQNAKVTYLDGTSVSWNGTLTYTYNNNGTPHILSDDTQTITGSLSGTTRQGTAYAATITKDIAYSVSCLAEDIDGPVSGVLEITSNGATALVNYGDGSCDNVYTVTVGGVTTEYTFE